MTKKHLGQHFLFDPTILRRIIHVAHLEKEDLIIEIGPGHGRLTEMLAEKVKKVITIELDEGLFEKLNVRLYECSNVEVVYGDALRYPYENLPEFKVVANIPFYISTPFIFRLLERGKKLKSMTITVQKEVAERICAKPGGKDYGVLSIMVQYYAMPSFMFIIPRGAFKPVPKVDSAVIHLKMLEKPSVSVKDEKYFFKIIKTSFSQRRKMLGNSLKKLRKDVKEWTAKVGIDSQRRPETLSIEEFARLSNTDE